MQTVHLTPADIARIRFSTARIPLLDSSLALANHRVKGRSGRPEMILDRVQLQLRVATRPLLDLTAGQVGPVFLDPLTTDIEEGLELLRATPRTTIRDEIHRVLGSRQAIIPTWVRNLADGDREELEIVATAVRACHDLFVAPRRSEYDGAFQRDIASRLPDLRGGGAGTVLAKLHPEVRFRSGTTLEFPHPRTQTLQMHGQGLELMPSVTWSGPPMLTFTHNEPDRWLLIYSAVPGVMIPAHQSDSLPRLVGATRAAILQQLWQPMTTGELATRLGISAASVSGHTTVLRDSGLITSRRHGRTVHHVLTALAEALIKGDVTRPL